MSSPVVFSYALNGPDAGKPLDGQDVGEALESPTLAWAHLDATHAQARDWVRDCLPYIDRHAVEALLAEETRPRVTEIGGGVLVFLRGVNLNEGAVPEDMVSIRLWADEKRIVSMRIRRLKAVTDIEEAVRAGGGPADTGAFLSMLIERLTARMEPVIRALDDAVDALEERTVDDPGPDLRPQITSVRRRAIVLRRYIAPQRDAVAALRSARVDWLSEMARRRLAEDHDRLTRIVEDLDAIRERAQIVKDEVANTLADRLNRNTYILSVIAAIFLPLGFLTGMLGVNLGGVPGAEDPAAFWIFSGVLVALVVLQIWLFRRLKWF